MLIVSLVAALAFVQAPQGPATDSSLRNGPTIQSEAKRLGVTPLALRRALRSTSNRQRGSLENPLYCLMDRLSVPSQPRWVCHTRAQWANAGFEPVVSRS
jgi:hypothetical protein